MGDPSAHRDPDGSRADMGAFPSNYGTPITMTLIVPNDYSTIQSAINKSAYGDTIFVNPGTYYEYLTLGYSNFVLMSLEGRDSTIIDGINNGTIFTILNSNIVI